MQFAKGPIFGKTSDFLAFRSKWATFATFSCGAARDDGECVSDFLFRFAVAHTLLLVSAARRGRHQHHNLVMFFDNNGGYGNNNGFGGRIDFPPPFYGAPAPNRFQPDAGVWGQNPARGAAVGWPGKEHQQRTVEPPQSLFKEVQQVSDLKFLFSLL